MIGTKPDGVLATSERLSRKGVGLGSVTAVGYVLYSQGQSEIPSSAVGPTRVPKGSG